MVWTIKELLHTKTHSIHYNFIPITQKFPNQFNQITKSGNYLISILNDENEILFTRRFVIYEELVNLKNHH